MAKGDMWKLEMPADTAERKVIRQMGHGMVAMMRHNKKTGDHIKLIHPDGSVTQHLLGASSDSADGFVVELPEGVEP